MWPQSGFFVSLQGNCSLCVGPGSFCPQICSSPFPCSALCREAVYYRLSFPGSHVNWHQTARSPDKRLKGVGKGETGVFLPLCLCRVFVSSSVPSMGLDPAREVCHGPTFGLQTPELGPPVKAPSPPACLLTQDQRRRPIPFSSLDFTPLLSPL